MTIVRSIAAATLLLATPAAATHSAAAPATRDYLHGRLAAADNRFDDAARFYTAALKADPTDLTLQRRAFDTAIAAGDERLATALARSLDSAKAGDGVTALVLLADALSRRDWAAAEAVRGLPDIGYAAAVGPVTGAWIKLGQGDTDGALALVDPAKFTGVAASYVGEHRALILVAAHRYAAADPLLAEMLGGEAKAVVRLRLIGAAALSAQHKAAAAAALLVGDSDPALVAAAARIAAGKPLDLPPLAPRDGVAILMTRLAGDLSRERPVPLAIDFARIATFLAPGSAETWLVAGDVLLQSDRAAAALAAYDHVPAGDRLAPVATTRRGAALSALGRESEARAIFEAAAHGPHASADDWQRLGDLERKLGRQAAAAAAYDRAIALAGAAAGWPLYFVRGAAYEQAGDWARAEPDLRAALKLAPDDPTVLNYLGYALLDRGERLPEATALVAAAAKQRPDDGSIADSLGWAYYRTGDFARAVAALETAARLEPGDATINDHLGDAYWRAGRRLEARFRWRAAADLSPEPAAAALLAKKLDFGLDIATAQAGR